MKKQFNILVSLALCLCFCGCVKMALRFTPSFIPNLSQTFFEECDPNLAKQSLPAGLKLMEGLLKSDPKNKQILTSLCTAFTGYALLFVEADDEDAASELYLRARDYGFRALDLRLSASEISATDKGSILNLVNAVEDKDLEPLFWTTMAWNAWINLNLDEPKALAQIGAARACLERVMEINSEYFHGAPYILKGSILSAMPGPLGGDANQAKEYYEKAMQLSQGKFFLVHYYFARYYAVSVQDKDLFLSLIDKVQNTSNDDLNDVCLINAVMKNKTKGLAEMSDDLFF